MLYLYFRIKALCMLIFIQTYFMGAFSYSKIIESILDPVKIVVAMDKGKGKGGNPGFGKDNNPGKGKGKNKTAVHDHSAHQSHHGEDSPSNKNKTVYTPKYKHNVKVRLFDKEWITLDIKSEAYSNDPNSRNQFGDIESTITINVHKFFEKKKQTGYKKELEELKKQIRDDAVKEMKENLDYAEKNYIMEKKEDGTWSIRSKHE